MLIALMAGCGVDTNRMDQTAHSSDQKLRLTKSQGQHSIEKSFISSAVDSSLRSVLTEFKNLKYYSRDSIPESGFSWILFYYWNKPGEFPYGRGLAIWNNKTEQVIWKYLHHGDFGPHTISWVDIDGDAHKDLIFLAGLEDVFSTYIYKWNLMGDTYSEDNLVLVYQNNNDYSVLMDLNSDGLPEVLDSGYEGFYHQGDTSAMGENECFGLTVSDSLRDVIKSRYYSIVGNYHESNFDYGMPSSAPFINMFIFDPIKILGFESGVKSEVSHLYQDEFEWRIGILSEIRSHMDDPCALSRVDSTLRYLRKRIYQ